MKIIILLGFDLMDKISEKVIAKVNAIKAVLDEIKNKHKIEMKTYNKKDNLDSFLK